jgi:tetratricopeptide (TPR) repeat protein
MTRDKKSEAVAPADKSVQPPSYLPLELIPLYDWWKKNGSQFIVQTSIAIILAGAVIGGVHYYKSSVATANKELLKANTIEELEALVHNYRFWKVGNTARLRLAKSYYDASKYEDALNAYDTCISKGAPVGFAEVAAMGRAVCFEALNRLDEAMEAYESFVKDNPAHFLVTQAQMGQARVLTLQGKKDEAKKLLETLKAEKNDDPMAEMAIVQLQGVIARYEPRTAVSVTDMSTAPVTAPAAVSEQPKTE